MEELTEAYMRSEVTKLQQEMDQLVHGTPAQVGDHVLGLFVFIHVGSLLCFMMKLSFLHGVVTIFSSKNHVFDWEF